MIIQEKKVVHESPRIKYLLCPMQGTMAYECDGYRSRRTGQYLNSIILSFMELGESKIHYTFAVMHGASSKSWHTAGD